MTEYLKCFRWTWFGTPYSIPLLFVFVLPYLDCMLRNNSWFWYCVFGLAVTVPGLPLLVYFQRKYGRK